VIAAATASAATGSKRRLAAGFSSCRDDSLHDAKHHKGDDGDSTGAGNSSGKYTTDVGVTGSGNDARTSAAGAATGSSSRGRQGGNQQQRATPQVSIACPRHCDLVLVTSL
jgi:hypothetical protein